MKIEEGPHYTRQHISFQLFQSFPFSLVSHLHTRTFLDSFYRLVHSFHSVMKTAKNGVRNEVGILNNLYNFFLCPSLSLFHCCTCLSVLPFAFFSLYSFALYFFPSSLLLEESEQLVVRHLSRVAKSTRGSCST